MIFHLSRCTQGVSAGRGSIPEEIALTKAAQLCNFCHHFLIVQRHVTGQKEEKQAYEVLQGTLDCLPTTRKFLVLLEDHGLSVLMCTFGTFFSRDPIFSIGLKIWLRVTH